RTSTATPKAAAAHTHGERSCSAPTTGATRGSEVDAGSADTVTEPGANAATDAGTGATAADEVVAAGRAAVTPGTDASSGPAGVVSRTVSGPVPAPGAPTGNRPCMRPAVASTSDAGSVAVPTEMIWLPMPAA